jgi:serine/threonine protein phosphatase PrpC
MMATTLPWRTLGASVRGASHLRSGAPNQDALKIDAREDAAVAVVADGHGGARHFRSADGARLAVQAAHEALLALAPAFAADESQRAQLAAVELPQRIVGRWVELTLADLAARPLTEQELAGVEAGEGAEAAASVRADPLLAYGATLLAALAVPGTLVIAQLGDGDVLLVDRAGHTSRPVPRDERLLGSFTTSICRPGAEADFRSVVLDGDAATPALLLLSTDGYANSFRSDGDYLQVGTDFLDLLRKHGAEAVGKQLPAILEDASTNGSGDDVTLAILAGDLTAAPGALRPPAARPATRSVIRHELSRAEQRIAQQRNVIAVLVVLLVGVIGWTQRERLVELWPQPPKAEAPTIVEQPGKGTEGGAAPAGEGTDTGVTKPAGGNGTAIGIATPAGGNGKPGDKGGKGGKGAASKGDAAPKGSGIAPKEGTAAGNEPKPTAEAGAAVTVDSGIAPEKPSTAEMSAGARSR